MHIIKYQRFPNNEVRATHYYKADSSKCKETKQPTSNVTSEIVASEAETGSLTGSPSYLTLGPISDSPLKPLPFKKTKFGLNAKNTLLRIGGAYDTLSDEPSDYVFLTGTLPGNTPAAFRAIAEYSSHIAESIGHWIQRTVKSEHYFYVWELQKRNALHFHYCVYCPSVEAKQKILSGFKPKWTDLLDDISSRSGVCLWETSYGTCHTDRYGVLQAYAQTVHTSVAAYLSGYLSGGKSKHAMDESSPHYPRRWWGASRKTTTLLKALTETTIVEHSSYRDAVREINTHYEDVLHDSPHAHRYRHTVGIGTTVVSYHPEDKGQNVWEGLSKMTLQHSDHPRIRSLILEFQAAHIRALVHIKNAKGLKQTVSKPLLLSLEDSTLWSSLQRWTLQDTHLSVLMIVKRHLLSQSLRDREQQNLLERLTLIEEYFSQNSIYLQWNRYGWLCNWRDLPNTVDVYVDSRDGSTTGSYDSDATGGAAHGSLSAQNSPHQLSLLPCSSDSSVYQLED